MEIFVATVPGLEAALYQEVLSAAFKNPIKNIGGVSFDGNWMDIWRANLLLRTASKVLVRLGNFKVTHLAKLDKKARSFPWLETLLPHHPVRVEVVCKKSRIYHHKAAAERFERALTEAYNIPINATADLCLKIRIIQDECTISLDTSGEGLHKRGHKQAVNKAPMRETLAASLLSLCGFDGTTPVVDPMCGSGTFPIEAAEISTGLVAGRDRFFAFEKLKTFDEGAFIKLKRDLIESPQKPPLATVGFYGFDRDKGAVEMSMANAERAGLSNITQFSQATISTLTAPEGPKGLIIINPPYGARIGDVKKLTPLYQSLGHVLKNQFSGWHVGLVTNTDKLAHATGLTFTPKPTAFSHGGINVKLYQADIS